MADTHQSGRNFDAAEIVPKADKTAGDNAGMVHTDIAIVGGGMAGLVTALAVAQTGLRVHLLDASPIAQRLDEKFDGRASAIAYANFRMLEVLGVGQSLRAKACPIATIMVTDGTLKRPFASGTRGPGATPSPFFMRFDANALETNKNENTPATALSPLSQRPTGTGSTVTPPRANCAVSTEFAAAAKQREFAAKKKEQVEPTKTHAAETNKNENTPAAALSPSHVSTDPNSTGVSHASGRNAAETNKRALGFLVENRHMRQALVEALAQYPNVVHDAPVTVTNVALNPRGAVVSRAGLPDVHAKLVVGADGTNSLVRRAMGVRDYGWNYDQQGIVATVKCQHDHQNIAHELFLPSGPFAILPLNNQRASLVWTERTAAANAAMALGEGAFVEQIRRRFGDFLGDIALEGPRWSYPLGLRIAEKFTGQRAVLVGDAARRIHPIAGQGFNLGLKDAAVLAEVLNETARAGLDIGSAAALDRYQTWRGFDSALLAVATDGFNRLFSNDIAPIRLARTLGMGAINAIPALRKLFARDAGADLGDLPALLRGQPLE